MVGSGDYALEQTGVWPQDHEHSIEKFLQYYTVHVNPFTIRDNSYVFLAMDSSLFRVDTDQEVWLWIKTLEV